MINLIDKTNVVIYSKEGCQYCEMAINLATKLNHSVQVKVLDTDFSKEDLLKIFPEAKTYPQIMVNNKVVGGYDKYKIDYGQQYYMDI